MANLTLLELSVVPTSTVQAAGLGTVVTAVQSTGFAAPQTRQLTLQQINDIVVAASKLIAGLTSSQVHARGSASVTGNSAINTGLASIVNLCVSIRGALASSVAAVSWSPLASAGWFSALVYANPVSSTTAPAQSTIAATVDWIAVGL